MGRTGGIAVVICTCRGRLARRIHVGDLEASAGRAQGVGTVRVCRELCRGPRWIATLSKSSVGMVIAGCGDETAREELESLIDPGLLDSGRWEIVSDGELAPFRDRELSADGTIYAGLVATSAIRRVRCMAGFPRRAPATSYPIGSVHRRAPMTRKQFLGTLLHGAAQEDRLTVDEGTCVHRDGGCTACMDSCPSSALVSRGGKISVAPGRCGRCGTCAVACPTGAISLSFFSPSKVTATVDSFAAPCGGIPHRALIFTCDSTGTSLETEFRSEGHPPGTPFTVRTPCIAAVSPTALLRAVERGYDAIVCTCGDSTCRNIPAAHRCALTVRAVNKLLESLDARPCLSVVMGDKDEVRQDTVRAWKSTIDACGRGLLNPHQWEPPPDAREAFRLIMGELADRQTVYRPLEGLPLPYFDVTVDRRACVLCGACEHNCPADALRMEISESRRMFFSPARCVGCGTCTTTCPEGAVRLERLLAPTALIRGKEILKSEDRRITCRQCGTPIGNDSLLSKVARELEGKGFVCAAEMVHLCENCKRLRTLIQG